MAITCMKSQELALFVLYRAGDFGNVCEIITDQASKDLEKKIYQYLFTSKKNGENEAERVLDGLIMTEMEELHSSCDRVSSL